MGQDSLYETIAVYDQLGLTYAERIADAGLTQLRDFAALLPSGARVLDVGCAAGRDSKRLHAMGFEVHGIDLSRVLLEIADAHVDGPIFYDMDARNLTFAPDYLFDGIWAQAVLLNLDRSEITETLVGFYRALQPGGVCLVAVKEGTGEKRIGEPLVNNLERRETYFQMPELKEHFTDAGFDIQLVFDVGDQLGRSGTTWLYVVGRKPKKSDD